VPFSGAKKNKSSSISCKDARSGGDELNIDVVSHAWQHVICERTHVGFFRRNKEDRWIFWF